MSTEPGSVVDRALRLLDLDTQLPSSHPGSMSRSGVYRVRVGDDDAVLKVTGAGQGQDGARRELAFYLTLAERVPVATPRLLAHVDAEALTALVLSSHGRALPARDWHRFDWLAAARELAALHSISAPHGELWRRRHWLQEVIDEPSFTRARDYWSGTPAEDLIAHVAEAPGALAEVVAVTEDCFIHGDCNVDNLLHDEGGRVVWVDWTGARIGSPVIDLVFLWGMFWNRRERVAPDPPREEIVREYAGLRGIDPATLRWPLVAAEIATLLFGWPGYARAHSREEQDRTTRRLIQLTEEWLSRPRPGGGAARQLVVCGTSS